MTMWFKNLHSAVSRTLAFQWAACQSSRPAVHGSQLFWNMSGVVISNEEFWFENAE